MVFDAWCLIPDPCCLMHASIKMEGRDFLLCCRDFNVRPTLPVCTSQVQASKNCVVLLYVWGYSYCPASHSSVDGSFPIHVTHQNHVMHPPEVAAYLGDVFDGIKSLDFSKDEGGLIASAIISKDGEPELHFFRVDWRPTPIHTLLFIGRSIDIGTRFLYLILLLRFSKPTSAFCATLELKLPSVEKLQLRTYQFIQQRSCQGQFARHLLNNLEKVGFKNHRKITWQICCIFG